MSPHNGFVKPPAIPCRYCGLSPTYCTCDRFLDARVGLFAFSIFELFQTRNARQGLREFYAEPFALAGLTTAACSRVSRDGTGGCFLSARGAP